MALLFPKIIKDNQQKYQSKKEYRQILFFISLTIIYFDLTVIYFMVLAGLIVRFYLPGHSSPLPD